MHTFKILLNVSLLSVATKMVSANAKKKKWGTMGGNKFEKKIEGKLRNEVKYQHQKSIF